MNAAPPEITARLSVLGSAGEPAVIAAGSGEAVSMHGDLARLQGSENHEFIPFSDLVDMAGIRLSDGLGQEADVKLDFEGFVGPDRGAPGGEPAHMRETGTELPSGGASLPDPHSVAAPAADARPPLNHLVLDRLSERLQGFAVGKTSGEVVAEEPAHSLDTAGSAPDYEGQSDDDIRALVVTDDLTVRSGRVGASKTLSEITLEVAAPHRVAIAVQVVGAASSPLADVSKLGEGTGVNLPLHDLELDQELSNSSLTQAQSAIAETDPFRLSGPPLPPPNHSDLGIMSAALSGITADPHVTPSAQLKARPLAQTAMTAPPRNSAERAGLAEFSVVDPVAEQSSGLDRQSASPALPREDARQLPFQSNPAPPSVPGQAVSPTLAVSSAASSAAPVEGEVREIARIQDALEQLASAREAGRVIRPELSLRHSEFGFVNMRLDASGAELRATLSSRDPAFVPAIQAALSERAIAAGSEAATGSSQRGQDQSSAQSGNSGGWQGWAGGGSDPRYGSSPGSGQASPQPYSEQKVRDEHEPAPRTTGEPSRSGEASGRGIYA